MCRFLPRKQLALQLSLGLALLVCTLAFHTPSSPLLQPNNRQVTLPLKTPSSSCSLLPKRHYQIGSWSLQAMEAQQGGEQGKNLEGDGNKKKRRPEIITRIQAMLSRATAFIRSKLLLKVNGRPVLRVRGWQLSLLFLIFIEFLRSVFSVRTKVPPAIEVPYSLFMNLVKDQGPTAIDKLRIGADRFDFLMNGVPHFTVPVRAHPLLLFFLDKYNVPFYASLPSRKGLVFAILLNLLPFAWILFSMGFYKRMVGDMTGSVGKNADEANIDRSLTFDDVAGIDKAKREVQELVDMLRSPGKYAKLGVRLPKGVLLAGPPGTGKTLLARVLAAEAGVPFLFCSGSDFVEMYIGRGAARVRALFERATKSAPCIIFMDELDGLGKQRSLRLSSSNDEVEQTLNQLLACMDGLDTNKSGVIVIGATNRYEVLDDALTRPGRLDRIVQVELPDRTGREAILRVHTRKVPAGPDVDLSRIAQITPGLSGADLAALVNEAAIRAVRRSSGEVNEQDFESAVRDFFKSRGSDAEKNWKRLMSSFGIAV